MWTHCCNMQLVVVHLSWTSWAVREGNQRQWWHYCQWSTYLGQEHPWARFFWHLLHPSSICLVQMDAYGNFLLRRHSPKSHPKPIQLTASAGCRKVLTEYPGPVRSQNVPVMIRKAYRLTVSYCSLDFDLFWNGEADGPDCRMAVSSSQELLNRFFVLSWNGRGHGSFGLVMNLVS